MSLSRADFEYELPRELIAQQPLASREQARMMVLSRGGGAIAHRLFHQLPDLLPSNAVLVLNNTRVQSRRLQARLDGGAKVEALLVEERAPGLWRALVKKGRRIRPAALVPFAEGKLPAQALQRESDGSWLFRFAEPSRLSAGLERYGLAPLPPYIRREETDAQRDAKDRQAYQTCFASVPGAIAAPTAGLHFVPEVLTALAERGIATVELTLHVGLGTFSPVKEEDPALHKMHSEWYELSSDSARRILRAKEKGRPVIAVGTTVVRALESWAEAGLAEGHAGWSELFIRPPYPFQVVEGLLTNFHQPGSTLLMLTAAFHDRLALLKTYQEAIAQRYRFFSYGDCMLILPADAP